MLRHYGAPHNDSVGMWNAFAPGMVIVGVGDIKDQGWAVIEQNAAWGSGIYGCDPEEVLGVIRYASDRRHPRSIIGD